MFTQFKRVLSGEKNIIDIWHYFIGNYRYKLYYSKYYKWLIRKFIRQQISWRILVMNKECYNNGSCIKCGCETTQLQMCSKMCEGSCYPELMNSNEWKKYQKSEFFTVKNDVLEDGFFKETVKTSSNIFN